MVSAISGINSYYRVYHYPRLQGLGENQESGAQAAQSTVGVLASRRGADPETPVQPVRSVLSVNQDTPHPVIAGMSSESERYAAEMAVRMRVRYVDGDSAGDLQHMGTGVISSSAAEKAFPAGVGADPAEMAVRMRIQYLDSAAQTGVSGRVEGAMGAEDVREAGEEGKCETCEKRKYQDGSDDMSVSFQTPTRIDPDAVAAAVRGHEMEHVAHEQAKALKEGRKVVSQSVTLHTGICPECGKAFVSGGTTRTVTKAEQKPEAVLPEQKKAA